MLLELTIKNFAIISDLHVSFDRGLNILTGETGVGKSIIIDALNLILGGRASSDLIRKGSQTCQVTAIFDVKQSKDLRDLLKGIIGSDFDEKEVLLRRQLSREGRNRCFINTSLTSLSILQLIGERLVDVHGQHEHQTLLKRKEQLNVLDSFANLFSLREKVSMLYKQYKHQKEEKDKLTSSEEERKRKIDFYQFEIEEINQAKLILGEEEELEKEYRLLSNAQELSVLYSGVYEKLHEREESILDLLKSVQKNLKEITQINCEVENVLENINNIFFELEEIGENVCGFKEKVKFDSPRLEEIVERKDLIIKLKRKYGDSIKKILEYKEKIEKELEQLLSYQENKEEIEKKIEKTKQELLELANNLSRQRQEAAKILEKRVRSQLRALSMDKVRFIIDCKEDELSFSGIDRIEFLISPNVGEDLKPISLIASGGELSRLMLALKTVLAKADDIPSLIFDEIDAGISGGVAKTIGQKLIELADIHQIICITHLPQIASFASVHFFVTKQVQKGRTETAVKKLARQERINEIARMLGGDKVSTLTLKHAEEMVKQAKNS